MKGFSSLRHLLQTDSGAQADSYPMGTIGSFPGGEADQSPPSNSEVKMHGTITAFSNMFSWRGGAIGL
jgi:hypothetical protein